MTSLEKHIKSNPYFTSTRLKSLYSNFENLRVVNPEGYEANVHAWNDLLVSLLREGCFAPASSLSIPSQSLFQKLTISQHGGPLSLVLVLNELVKRHGLIPLTQYEKESESFYKVRNNETSYADYVSPKKWLQWSISTVFPERFLAGNSNGEQLVPENYIDWNFLVSVGTEVESLLKQKVHSYSSRVYGIDEFSALLRNLSVLPAVSDVDVRILLTFLSRDRDLLDVISHPEGDTYIKIYSNSGEEKFFTEEDVAVIELKKSIFSYEQRQIQLDAKINEVDAKVKGLLGKESMKPRALKLLQTKKLFTRSYEQCSSSLLQLQEVIIKINDATDNASMMKVLALSSNALKILNSKTDLGQMDTIIQNLDENVQLTDEISESLGNLGAALVSDDEIERELEDLQKQNNPASNLTRLESEKLITKLKDLEIKNKEPIEDREPKKN